MRPLKGPLGGYRRAYDWRTRWHAAHRHRTCLADGRWLAGNEANGARIDR